jgi:mannose-6-phosphate isomerase
VSAAEPVDPALCQPLRFDRACLEKVWGGRALEQTPGIALSAEGPIGEVWELADREEHTSKVAWGPLAGRSLRGLLEDEPQAMLGRARLSVRDRFPLLIKYLCAGRPLSVQVHPDDAAARRMHLSDAGKFEAWYVLAAEPGSVLYLGLQPGVDAARFAAQAGGPGVADLLMAWPAHAGQFAVVPAGTLHSIGAGVTVVEIQQNSDVTFRLYDWDRMGLDGEPREVHLEQALLALDYEAQVEGPHEPLLEERSEGNRGAVLCDGEHFGIELLEVGTHVDLETDDLAIVYIVISGRGGISREAAHDDGLAMDSGDTWFVPACVGAHRLEARGEPMNVLRVETRA